MGWMYPTLPCYVDWACPSDMKIVDFVSKLKWSIESSLTKQAMPHHCKDLINMATKNMQHTKVANATHRQNEESWDTHKAIEQTNLET